MNGGWIWSTVFLSVDKIIWFVFFFHCTLDTLVCTEFLMSNQTCIPGVNPT